MIIIYTQDFTAIKSDADDAKETLYAVYGAKIGQEAYNTVKDAPVGTRYRKNGGPLVVVATEAEVKKIQVQEQRVCLL